MLKAFFRVLYMALFMVVISLFLVSSYSIAAEKRCTVEGKKVVCPTHTDAFLEKAAANYEGEAMDMMMGKAGSTYGVSAYDYLTGVGKRTVSSELTLGESGYRLATGKTEMWDRVNKPSGGESVRNQWTNNWSPTFKQTLVPGADPNEGKQWYYFYCIACHGWTLQGDGPNAIYIEPRPRILTKGSYMNKKSNVELFAAIKSGGEGVDLSPAMPAWGNLLQDQDIWNVISWIRANADVKQHTTLGEYLNPKSSFNPKSKANKVNALNAKDSPDFQEAQEIAEATLAGRGGGDLVGGGYVEGGLRKSPKKVDAKIKAGY
jgi:mono/diheme cytochrome c family protein